MKKNPRVTMALLFLAPAVLAQVDSQWVLAQSTLTYHVSHTLHQTDGVSHAARGKGVCHAGQCDFLIAVPVSAFMLAGLRSVTASYARHRIASAPVRAEDKEVREPDEVAPEGPGGSPQHHRPEPGDELGDRPPGEVPERPVGLGERVLDQVRVVDAVRPRPTNRRVRHLTTR